jgi:hypothetical protein
MDSKKPTDLPPSLKGLPRYSTTSTRSSSRKDSERPDVAFDVNSMDDLVEKLKRGFANPDAKKSSSSAS